ncbi:dipeptide/oligopeptide/nickel ABC transporter permease/ATP-binding protein [Promicromonospora panici]|uniref:dipeptide/oligopeptide/nickel ABC transporter permease/ATP-binding protein n=1 Tax=Promicromonospora panici TaxID=2219658 RepID=UPI00101BEAD5|nr:dipeptide/oligopeptide/nickel ABC transporter permease/ATP-binding protein [Promicromonospora panici]
MSAAPLTTAPLTTAVLRASETGADRSLTRRLLRNPLGLTAIVLLGLIVLLSVLAPWIAPHDPNHVDLAVAFDPPSATHWLGADSAGRDVLSRLLTGGRLTLLGAAIGLTVAVVVGLVSGLVAGYYGGWFDTLSDLSTSLVMALPNMMILLAIRVVVGPSLWITMAVFGLLISPSIYRLVRSGVRQVRGELYVDAARVSGLSDARIIARHVLFVVRAPIIIQAAIIGGIAIAIQSGLEFLGLGDQTVPTWGVMLSEGFGNLYIAPLLILWPGLAIALTIGSLVLFGNALRDALEDKPAAPRLRGGVARQSTATATATATADDDVALSVRGLTVGYPTTSDALKTVIESVTFDVRRGEILGLVGESGSGKTQTAWSVLGLLPRGAVVESGAIVHDGVDLLADAGRTQRGLLGRRIAYVPQEPMSNLDPYFTVGHQLVAPMRKHLGLGRAEARDRATQLLAHVGIPDPVRTMKAYPHEISGGMAQRVLIAGAVSCDPDLIVADEPTTALDVTVQAEILDLLRSLQAERGLSMVLVTHNFGVVADLCDSVVVLRGGQVVEQGPAAALLSAPQHPYTRDLLAATLDGTAPRSVSDAAYAELEAAR